MHQVCIIVDAKIMFTKNTAKKTGNIALLQISPWGSVDEMI